MKVVKLREKLRRLTRRSLSKTGSFKSIKYDKLHAKIYLSIGCMRYKIKREDMIVTHFIQRRLHERRIIPENGPKHC